jgi:hypothetical protein
MRRGRLSERERGELEHRRELLQTEIRLIEAELRSDDRLRVADRIREAERGDGARPRLAGRWRSWVR